MIRSPRNQLKTRNLKKLAGLSTGLGFLAAGWTIYSNHGFDSSMLFFIGLLLVPLGVITLGISLVGSSEETYN